MVPGVLAALEANPYFAPTDWGRDERTRQPYRSRDVVSYVRGLRQPMGETVLLYRRKATRFDGYLTVHERPFLSFEFDRKMPEARWKDLLDWADRIADITHPRLGTLHRYGAPTDPWGSDQDRMADWMHYSAHCTPANFKPYGPIGLGMRTYFGGDVLELLGRRLLLKTPAIVKELAWGGIRIDLTDDLMNSSSSEILAAWGKAMKHLEKAKVFALPAFDERRSRITFTPSAAWSDRKREI